MVTQVKAAKTDHERPVPNARGAWALVAVIVALFVVLFGTAVAIYVVQSGWLATSPGA